MTAFESPRQTPLSRSHPCDAFHVEHLLTGLFTGKTGAESAPRRPPYRPNGESDALPRPTVVGHLKTIPTSDLSVRSAPSGRRSDAHRPRPRRPRRRSVAGVRRWTRGPPSHPRFRSGGSYAPGRSPPITPNPVGRACDGAAPSSRARVVHAASSSIVVQASWSKASWSVRRGPCVVVRASWSMRRGPCVVVQASRSKASWSVRRGPCVVVHASWSMRRGPCVVVHPAWPIPARTASARHQRPCHPGSREATSQSRPLPFFGAAPLPSTDVMHGRRTEAPPRSCARPENTGRSTPFLFKAWNGGPPQRQARRCERDRKCGWGFPAGRQAPAWVSRREPRAGPGGTIANATRGRGELRRRGEITGAARRHDRNSETVGY